MCHFGCFGVKVGLDCVFVRMRRVVFEVGGGRAPVLEPTVNLSSYSNSTPITSTKNVTISLAISHYMTSTIYLALFFRTTNGTQISICFSITHAHNSQTIKLHSLSNLKRALSAMLTQRSSVLI